MTSPITPQMPISGPSQHLTTRVLGHKQTHLGNQNPITNCHAAADPLSILIQSTGANSQDPRLVELLDARFREEDAGRGASLGLDALDQDAVEQRGESLDGLECGCL